jgi:hypothetical protein
METGRDFLRAQINNTIALHQSVIGDLESHVKQADEPAYRQLCTKWLPKMQEHQRILEQYGASIGADGKGGIKHALGAVLGKARDTVDAMRETDFLRIVGDTVMVRQLQDTFATFAEAGDQLGDGGLSKLGKSCTKELDTMQKEFNQLTQEMFVDHVKGAVPA